MIDGIYFDLPEEVYHALPRLSVSGMQRLLVSPATFWAGSWPNPVKAATLAASLAASASPLAIGVLEAIQALHPDLPEADAEDAEEATKAQLLGKAYHCARLEPDALDARYVRALEKSDMPKGALFTGTEMGMMLASMDLPKAGSVAEQAVRLAEAGFDTAKLWHWQLAEWENARAGRTPIPGRYWDEIKADMDVIQSTPEIAALLTGGYAEVSILWTDAHGIPMKARLDYLRPDLWADFKTFANPNGKQLEQCIADAFIYNRYHVQAAGYRAATDAIDNAEMPVYGTDAQRAMVEAIRADGTDLACWYVFQEKGGVPNLLAKQAKFYEVPVTVEAEIEVFSRTATHGERVRKLNEHKSLWLSRAEIEIRKAKRLFRAYSEIYQPGEPWRPFNPLGEISDLNFTSYWLDAEIAE